jgi:beta-lactamase superfamily II metal-dependent hydrolase
LAIIVAGVCALAGCQAAAVRTARDASERRTLVAGEAEQRPLVETQLYPVEVGARLKRPPLELREGMHQFVLLSRVGDEQVFSPRPIKTGEMAVHAINVGQADAFLLEFPCGAALVDTGLQAGNVNKERFVSYIDWFFTQRRPDLKGRFNLVAISHSHADHANGVIPLFQDSGASWKVDNAIDNGYDTAAGADDQQFLREHAKHYQAVRAENILWTTGATSSVIDPLGKCPGDVDPVIRVLWGGLPETSGAFKNPNHHSVVMRVDYGEASFLFTGDVQTADNANTGGGLGLMLDDYAADPSIFDVDALKVAHHGAENGTNARLLALATPCIAFMGVGDPAGSGSGSAPSYGHPRRVTLDLLADAVSADRPRRDVQAFDRSNVAPKTKQLTKAVFGTAWDGSYVIYASNRASFAVETSRGESVPISCR